MSDEAAWRSRTNNGLIMFLRKPPIPTLKTILLGCLSIWGLCITPSLPQPLTNYEAIIKQKEAIALNLSIPPATCVVRHDIDHPAFHGCVDWHSAVSGTLALIGYTRITGDTRYLPLIQEILRPENLAAEQSYLKQHPDFEMPYGRAWLLRLAIEYPSEALFNFADEVADSLLANYQENGVDPAADEYDNAAWALINLWDYALLRQNLPMMQAIRDLVLSVKASPCSIAPERPGFMSPCLNWAWLISKILPLDEFIPWLMEFMPELPAPVQKPLTTHHYGLNFSRAWGLWGLYKATGYQKYADLFADHFWTGYKDPQNWSGNYHTVAHWVANFGLFALLQVVEDQP